MSPTLPDDETTFPAVNTVLPHLLWQIIAEVRDAYPRAIDDAPTDVIVQALINAGVVLLDRDVIEQLRQIPGPEAVQPVREDDDG